jgi:ElaB/YqjD/DUF883 family membrane-anchored ribosome-binding protein
LGKVPEEKKEEEDVSDTKSMKSRKSVHLPTEMRDPDKERGDKGPVIDSKALDDVNDKIAAMKEEISKIAFLKEEVTKLSEKTADLEKANKDQPAPVAEKQSKVEPNEDILKNIADLKKIQEDQIAELTKKTDDNKEQLKKLKDNIQKVLGKVKDEFSNSKKETAEKIKDLQEKVDGPGAKASPPADDNLKKDVEKLKLDLDEKVLKELNDLVEKQTKDKKELESGTEALRKSIEEKLSTTNERVMSELKDWFYFQAAGGNEASGKGA